MASFIWSQVGGNKRASFFLLARSWLSALLFSQLDGPHILCSDTLAFIKCGPLQYADRRCAGRITRNRSRLSDLISSRRWSNSSFFSIRLSGCFDGAAGCFITFTRTCRISVSVCNLKRSTFKKLNGKTKLRVWSCFCFFCIKNINNYFRIIIIALVIVR